MVNVCVCVCRYEFYGIGAEHHFFKKKNLASISMHSGGPTAAESKTSVCC